MHWPLPLASLSAWPLPFGAASLICVAPWRRRRALPFRLPELARQPRATLWVVLLAVVSLLPGPDMALGDALVLPRPRAPPPGRPLCLVDAAFDVGIVFFDMV